MKLNNRGWGLKEMLLICGAIIIAGFTSFVIYKQTFGNGDIMDYAKSHSNSIENKINPVSYTDIENKMVKAADEYSKKENIDFESLSAYYVKLSILEKDKYIETVSVENEKCTGYVKITKASKVPYLKCTGYQSTGYDEQYD